MTPGSSFNLGKQRAIQLSQSARQLLPFKKNATVGSDGGRNVNKAGRVVLS
jgi:hypothetical protein